MKILKKILITIIILLFLFLLKSNVLAVSNITTIYNQTYQIPDFDFSTLGDRPYFIDYENEYGWIEICTPYLSGDNYLFFINDNQDRVFCLVDGVTSRWDTYYVRNGINDTFTYYAGNTMAVISNTRPIVYSTIDVYCNDRSTVFFDSNSLVSAIEPYILDVDESLSTLNIDFITVDSGTIDYDELNFFISTNQLGSNNASIVYITDLDSNSTFYNSGGVNGDYFEIPVSVFKSSLNVGYEVDFVLQYWKTGADSYSYIKRSVIYNPSSIVESDTDKINNNITSNFNIIRNILNNLTEEQKQQAKAEVERSQAEEETRKGILATIKEVLSYINPLSENFFAYKLVDLLLQGLKNLFIPSDEFFSNFFNDLKNWFSERFGFLMYPFELLIEILNRILNINLIEPIIDIPEIVEPVTNTKLINSINFNFNDLLENNVLNTVHNIYLIILDAFIIFGLVNLAKSKFEEVITK